MDIDDDELDDLARYDKEDIEFEDSLDPDAEEGC